MKTPAQNDAQNAHETCTKRPETIHRPTLSLSPLYRGGMREGGMVHKTSFVRDSCNRFVQTETRAERCARSQATLPTFEGRVRNPVELTVIERRTYVPLLEQWCRANRAEDRPAWLKDAIYLRVVRP